METPYRIEPCFLEGYNETIASLLAGIPKAAEKLGGRLHPLTAASLADLVRVMNCYYSNLIESHKTRPVDIERALDGNFPAPARRRHLVEEAVAHIRLQEEIDRMARDARLPNPASRDFIAWLHHSFYEKLPPELLTIPHGEKKFLMTAGEMRRTGEPEVVVGRHQPPSSASLVGFMEYFEEKYDPAKLSPASQLIAIAAAHHRLNYIHPFHDGNGRVSRLMSHAMAHRAGIGAHGLWSIARGLARGLSAEGGAAEYKRMMEAADTPRLNDYDGRGNLSLRALEDFVAWFLRVILDQLNFMTEQFDFGRMEERFALYVARRELHPASLYILRHVWLTGEMARGEAARLTGLGERAARSVLAKLLDDKILAANSARGPVHLNVGFRAAEILFPNLYGPEAQTD